jgi:hypothetical protein
MTLQSTKIIRFILHFNLWITIPIFLHFMNWYFALHPYSGTHSQAEATTNLTFLLELAVPLAVWAWFAQRGLSELNKLRAQAAKDQSEDPEANKVLEHENAAIQKTGWSGRGKGTGTNCGNWSCDNNSADHWEVCN